jgi:hypothetical protein
MNKNKKKDLVSLRSGFFLIEKDGKEVVFGGR